MPPRRARIAALGATAALGLLAGAAALTRGGSDEEPAGASGAARANVLLLISDDQTLRSFTPRVMPRTFELLAGPGTRFENAIITTPLCCPARASLLTGQYGHNNGVLQNNYNHLRAPGNVLPVWLQRAGYVTAHVGKWLNLYEKAGTRKVAPGWDHWHTALAPRRYYDYELQIDGERVARYGRQPDDHLTRVLTRRASRLIEGFARDDRPFFLQLDYYSPHNGGPDLTGRCPQGPVPDPRDADAFVDEPLPDIPSIDEADVSDKRPVVAGLGRMTDAEKRLALLRWRCELASMRGVDRSIASLVEALEEAGQLEDTMIAFISDNGYFHGEHRIPTQKHYPYEEAIRVPLVVRAPDALAGSGGPPERVTEPVANIDIPATIVQLAGAEPCAGPGRCRTMDGRSLLPLLAGDGDWPERRRLALELQLPDERSTPGGVCGYAGAWTPEAVLIEHDRLMAAGAEACEPRSFTELYDLRVDPHQLDNLGDRPEAAPLRADLGAALRRLRRCAGIRGRDERTGRRPFCE